MKQTEIEKKFIVNRNLWMKTDPVSGKKILQGYLSLDEHKVIRVRIYGNQGYLTIKRKMHDFGRPEFEYEIPITEAQDLMGLTIGYPIEKVRYVVRCHGKTWEVDVFDGLNKGLILAEIELKDPDEQFDLPDWTGEEVTYDHRYYNSFLAEYPFGSWGEKKGGA